jgi:nucleotide-binding universal stress UspA family protein
MTDNAVGSTAGSKHWDVPPIVVGVDGSESSVKALREARRLADALHAPLEAVAVWQQTHSMYDFYQSQSGWTPEKEIEKLLRDVAEAAFGSDRPEQFRMSMLQGPPAKALIRHSAGAEMLVLGSRGHGGFAGLLLGSVSSACVAHATCPVLIVHNNDQVRLDAEKSTATH